jgi:hypothetical protein
VLNSDNAAANLNKKRKRPEKPAQETGIKRPAMEQPPQKQDVVMKEPEKPQAQDDEDSYEF